MKILLFVFIGIFVVDGVKKLGTEENKELQKTCGLKALRSKTEGNIRWEYPWAMSLYIDVKETINGTTKSRTAVITGTIISPNHILALNLFQMTNNKLNIAGRELLESNGTCLGDLLVVPEEIMSRMVVDFQSYVTMREAPSSQLPISNIFIPDGCSNFATAKLMVFELPIPLKFSNDLKPACFSESPKNWLGATMFQVYGPNKSKEFDSVQYSSSNCTIKEPFVCAEKVEKKTGPCIGNYAGNAVANINGRHTILGFYSDGNRNCNKESNTEPDYKFIDASFYRDSICKSFGICVSAKKLPFADTLTKKEKMPNAKMGGSTTNASEPMEVNIGSENLSNPSREININIFLDGKKRT
ncbi:hypothetical protein GCK72_022487 [Caenorhabditis remanei]|uniref:Peptidase S1 domain-containing protein n=1 Tax=Caenorhabditis remanei TaxID=31234 RepID=A0A6A5FU54_CAERE|nr:hypothetical protein GCK72_022487 [Caenorhabditis remanei]KAF1746036.1 hypothetical protein GCK72_022487 [Caenorhabditis remanei]